MDYYDFAYETLIMAPFDDYAASELLKKEKEDAEDQMYYEEMRELEEREALERMREEAEKETNTDDEKVVA